MPDNPFCFEGHQLPELFLLGVQKCGTTSLTKQLFTEWGFFGDAQAKGLCTAENRRYASKNGHDCAGTHDNFPYTSNVKEKHFYDHHQRYDKGLSHYAQSFPPCSANTHTLDATPNYFYTAQAPATCGDGASTTTTTTTTTTMTTTTTTTTTTTIHDNY